MGSGGWAAGSPEAGTAEMEVKAKAKAKAKVKVKAKAEVKAEEKLNADGPMWPPAVYKSIWTESMKRPGPETVKALG